MAKINRPLKVVRSKPITHKYIMKELKKQQVTRMPIKPKLKQFKPEPKPEPEPKPKSKKPPAQKKLCIGTIFVDCGELGEKWLDLQLRYIKATTSDFHHVSLVQNGDISNFFSDNTEIIRPFKVPRRRKPSHAHIVGLQSLHAHFLKNQDLYEDFLFLDMDAFPIRKNWHEILLHNLHGGLRSGTWEIATALRCENLETRLHSSILFADKQGLQHLKWRFARIGPDLVGKMEADVQLISHQKNRRNKAFVLLRSNQHQIHPLLCGVYYDLFYHHGCGSGRKFNMRSRPYWGHISPKFNVSKSINDLMDNPNEFIGNLAGWHRSEYPQIEKGHFV